VSHEQNVCVFRTELEIFGVGSLRVVVATIAVTVEMIKVGSHCRSDQLDQARSSDREPVLQVVGVVGIDRVSYKIIFDCPKSRVAIEY